MVTDELKCKIAEYGSFISQKLEPQLRNAVMEREKTEAEINDYIQLQSRLRQLLHEQQQQQEEEEGSSSLNEINKRTKQLTKQLDGLVDIAHSTIFCNVSIPNPNILYVNVGFEFHIEMTITEAITFIDKRVDFLEKLVLKHRVEVAMKIAKDVEDALELLEELGGEKLEV
jgi:prefoldin subunit 5